MYLSPHFSLAELTASNTAKRRGFDNTPSPYVLENLRVTAEAMEEIRAILGKAIIVTSGFRSAIVNQLVGGSQSSAHVQGFAVDFISPGFGTPFEVAREIAKHKDELKYDQLIHEYRDWTHISFDPRARKIDNSIFTPGRYLLGILP